MKRPGEEHSYVKLVLPVKWRLYYLIEVESITRGERGGLHSCLNLLVQVFCLFIKSLFNAQVGYRGNKLPFLGRSLGFSWARATIVMQ